MWRWDFIQGRNVWQIQHDAGIAPALPIEQYS